MSMHTRVVFRDGTAQERDWPGGESPAQTLSQAIAEAEEARGEDHNGAWLEFRTLDAGDGPWTTKTGKTLTGADLDALAEEAERGYPVSEREEENP